MQIKIISPLNYPEWDELLLTNKKYSFFHSSYWARVLSESYKYEPVYFTEIDNGNLSLAIPVIEIKSVLTGVRGVSLPFTDICEPILPKNTEQRAIWKVLTDYGEKAGWKYLEIRGGNGFGQIQHPSSWYYEHILDLSQGEQKIYSQFRNSTKRNIKKAKKDNVKVTICDSLESIQEFYHLNCLTRKRHGLPPQPYSFFKKVHEHILAKKHGIMAIARYKEKAIAANLYLHFGNKVIYKYGASENKLQHLRPNNIVMWKAIEWYCQKGYSNFSFGITDPGHSGLRQFKKGWGAKEKVINYYCYNFLKKDFVTTSSKVHGWHTNIFKKTPIPISRMIGSILYKHIG